MASSLVLCHRKRALACVLCGVAAACILSVIHTPKSLSKGVVIVDDMSELMKSLQPLLNNTAVTNISLQPRFSIDVANASTEDRKLFTTPCYSSSFSSSSSFSPSSSSPSSFSSLFWPNNQEWNVQPLFEKRETTIFMEKIHSLCVVSLEKGCSSSKSWNRLATLEDGTKVCCRYMVIGNIYSYHLNWLLGLRNIPPVTAVIFNQTNEKWSSVHDAALNAGWRDGCVIIMELFIENLTEVYTSPYFNGNKTSVLTVPYVQRMPLTSLDKNLMVQWSDMILFDFLIGHTDRLLLKYFFKDLPMRNLYKTPSFKLVLIDNESAFSQKKNNPSALYLKRTCAFRQNTVENILNLESQDINSSSPVVVLQNYIKEKDLYTYSLILGRLSKNEMETIDRNMRQHILKIKHRLRLCQSLVGL